MILKATIKRKLSEESKKQKFNLLNRLLTVESSTTEQSTFKHVTRRARSSKNRNAVNIERSCRTSNNSRENCSKMQNEQEMQL